MKTDLKILKAFHGDCILLKTYDIKHTEFNILIDGGTASTFDYCLHKELKKIKRIDLLVVTHIDSDHIKGIIKFIKNSIFKSIEIAKYWVNCPNLIHVGGSEKISYNDGKNLEILLIEKGEPPQKWNQKISYNSTFEISTGINIDILSPTNDILDELFNNWDILKIKNHENANSNNTAVSSNTASQLTKGTLQDLAAQPFKPSKTIQNDIFNSSSIAFILTTFDCKILFLADSRPEIIVKSLIDSGYDKEENKLHVNYVKISHHGSINNTSCELLDFIDCDNFIISTNGGNSRSKHPDREVLARIIHHPKRNYEKRRTVIFNYPILDIQKKTGQLFDTNDFKNGNWEIKEL